MKGPAERGDEQRRMRRITVWGLVANVLLAGLKLAAGLWTGSVALVADGAHSVSDLLSDVIVLVGIALAARPPDREHPYGHGRFETLASVLVAVLLVVAGGWVGWEAVADLSHHDEASPGVPMIGVALVSVVVKEVLYRFTARLGRRTRSAALLANAWHHRSDALSSVAVLLGGIAALFEVPHADHVAGVVVAVLVVLAGLRIAGRGLGEFLERGIEGEVLEQVQACLEGHDGVLSWHQLRGRRVGREVFIDVHVLVDPLLTVREGHEITDQLERAIEEKLSEPVNVIIHLEPHDEEHILSGDDV